MTKISRQQWGKIREQGIGFYLFLYWILSAAFPAAIIFTVLRWLLQDRNFSFFTTGSFIEKLLMSFIFCSVAALIIGFRKWFINERLYGV